MLFNLFSSMCEQHLHMCSQLHPMAHKISSSIFGNKPVILEIPLAMPIFLVNMKLLNEKTGPQPSPSILNYDLNLIRFLY